MEAGSRIIAWYNLVVSDSPTTSCNEDVLTNWLAAMRRGDFEAAWRQTDRIELQRREQQRSSPEFQRAEHHLVWDGSPLDGRVVLIQCWHGLGDTIQFLRYAPVVQSIAKRVIVMAQPMLLSLLQGMHGIDELRNSWTKDPNPPHDVEIEVMELPYAFRHTADALPCRVPYLPVERILSPTPELPIAVNGGRRKVGLVWASSSWDTTRSVPLSLFAALAARTDLSLYSLQQGPELAELKEVAFPIVNLSPHTEDIRDAAAAMLQLDAIVCVDTMAAHLAGALGRPVSLLLQHAADWRWQDERSDCPWYPTMRIYRQPSPGDWAGAVAAMVREL